MVSRNKENIIIEEFSKFKQSIFSDNILRKSASVAQRRSHLLGHRCLISNKLAFNILHIVIKKGLSICKMKIALSED